jgi:hypothetical protein
LEDIVISGVDVLVIGCASTSLGFVDAVADGVVFDLADIVQWVGGLSLAVQ